MTSYNTWAEIDHLNEAKPMDSHEARAKLRIVPTPLSVDGERYAVYTLLCDIHEWMEEIRNAREPVTDRQAGFCDPEEDEL